MKMVKSLLLGSAAGLVAVTAGQAAELPVKARPVQYVKVCSLYGAGFYYMPGTDLCIKIGGWVRFEATDVSNGNLAQSSGAGIFQAQSNNRFTSDLGVRDRGYITADAREETAYGVARAYIDAGFNGTDVGGGGLPAASGLASNTNRAFVQWAGFTAGLSASFFDFYSIPATNYRGFIAAEDTGDPGWTVFGYTAQFGGGFSATLSAEDRRNTQIIGQDAPAANASGVLDGTLLNTTAGTGYAGWKVPDIVANLRVDQAWGSAQVMAAYHDVNAPYYGGPAGGATSGVLLAANGHPADAAGWAVGGGLKVNFPMVAAGDYFQGEVNYSQGALGYLNFGQRVTFWAGNGATEGLGVQSDCVYGGAPGSGNATNCNLTTGWSAIGAYEHYWTPAWHQSLVGGYFAVNYNAQANGILCNLEGAAEGNGGFGTGATATAGCNNNFAYWGVGSRLQWDVTKSFYVGVEVLYQQLNSATLVGGAIPANAAIGLGNGAQCSTVGGCTVANQSDWGVTIRMHKDFLP